MNTEALIQAFISPALFAGAVIPAAIAALLFIFRKDNSGLLQSPADLLVIPLTMDAGILLVKSAFKNLVEVPTFGESVILFAATLVVLWLVVARFEVILDEFKNNKISQELFLPLLIATWILAIAVYSFHFLIFYGALPNWSQLVVT